MSRSSVAAGQHWIKIALLSFVVACGKPELKTSEPTIANSSARMEQQTSALPSVRPRDVNAVTGAAEAGAAKAQKIDAVGSTTASASTAGISAETIDLKSIVKPMLERSLFKLGPETVQAYFTNIADLQPRPTEETWLRGFQGRSKLPWLHGALIELQQEEDGRWRLGQSQVTWFPPKDQARGFYDRLVAVVRAVRARKPDFGEDESTGEKLQRHSGWTWCRDRCQAVVALDSDGHMSLDQTIQVDENRPVVLLQVFTPEGP
jgi:hypothetical protein